MKGSGSAVFDMELSSNELIKKIKGGLIDGYNN